MDGNFLTLHFGLFLELGDNELLQNTHTHAAFFPDVRKESAPQATQVGIFLF